MFAATCAIHPVGFCLEHMYGALEGKENNFAEVFAATSKMHPLGFCFEPMYRALGGRERCLRPKGVCPTMKRRHPSRQMNPKP